MKRAALSLIVFLAVPLSACAIAPTNLSGIKVGAKRATVQDVLGKPVESMQTESGKIDTYKYNRGYTPTEPTRPTGGPGSGCLPHDGYCALGALIVVAVVAPIAHIIRYERQREDIEVTYDPQDTVVRVDPTRVALLVTEGCEGRTPREPDIGEQTSSGLAPETLCLSLFFPNSGISEYRWDGAMLVLKDTPRDPDCPPTRVEISPSVDAWRKFWAELDDLDVWSWQRSYEKFMVDAIVWELEVRGRGKYVRVSGLGAFPPNGLNALYMSPLDSPKFMRLLKAFRTLNPLTGEAAEDGRC